MIFVLTDVFKVFFPSVDGIIKFPLKNPQNRELTGQ